MSSNDARFVEVLSPGWAFWRALLDTCIGLIVGSLYTFLGIVVAGIVGEEALSTLYRQIDLDPVFRASMGVILLVAAVLGVAVPSVFVAERFSALRAAQAASMSAADAVPQHSLRMELRTSPAAHLQMTGLVLFWCVAGLGGIFALGVLFTEDLREDAISWIVLAGFTVAALLAVIPWRLGGRAVRTHAARLDELHERWQRLVPRAVSADRERREAAVESVVPHWLTTPSARILKRIAMILTAATLISVAAFILSVFMRQQCRTCDPVYWDEPIENGIDVLSLGSGAAIAVCAALGLVAWVGGVLLQLVRESALARWASVGGARRVDVSVVEPLLTENRALVRLQFGLSVVGAGAVVAGMGALWADSPLLDARAMLAAAAVVIVLGFVIGWSDAPRSRRHRQIVREATSPGDVKRAGSATRAEGSKTPRQRS